MPVCALCHQEYTGSPFEHGVRVHGFHPASLASLHDHRPMLVEELPGVGVVNSRALHVLAERVPTISLPLEMVDIHGSRTQLELQPDPPYTNSSQTSQQNLMNLDLIREQVTRMQEAWGNPSAEPTPVGRMIIERMSPEDRERLLQGVREIRFGSVGPGIRAYNPRGLDGLDSDLPLARAMTMPVQDALNQMRGYLQDPPLRVVQNREPPPQNRALPPLSEKPPRTAWDFLLED